MSRSLSEQFRDLRAALQEARLPALDIPARNAIQRPNAFVQMLDAEVLGNNATPG